MSLPLPISISDGINMVGEHLSLWAEPLGGKVKVVANTRHLWEEIYACATSDSPQILLCFLSERVRGGADRRKMTRVDRSFWAVIMRGHGFRNKMAKDDEGGGSAMPDDFYTACEQVRDQIRVILSISEEFPVEYVGMEPLPGVAVPGTANVFLDAYRIEWRTANDIGAIGTQAPELSE